MEQELLEQIVLNNQQVLNTFKHPLVLGAIATFWGVVGWVVTHLWMKIDKLEAVVLQQTVLLEEFHQIRLCLDKFRVQIAERITSVETELKFSRKHRD